MSYSRRDFLKAAGSGIMLTTVAPGTMVGQTISSPEGRLPAVRLVVLELKCSDVATNPTVARIRPGVATLVSCQ